MLLLFPLPTPKKPLLSFTESSSESCSLTLRHQIEREQQRRPLLSPCPWRSAQVTQSGIFPGVPTLGPIYFPFPGNRVFSPWTGPDILLICSLGKGPSPARRGVAKLTDSLLDAFLNYPC